MLTKSLLALLFLFNPFAFVVPLCPPAQVSQESQSENRLLSSVLPLANPNFLPIRDWSIVEPDIKAQAAIVYVQRRRSSFKDNTLYQRNIDTVYPIASLTKIMTAVVAVENMALEDIVEVSGAALAEGYGERGGLVRGEKISVEKLLYVLLMESSNDAAFVLAERCDKFVGLMNKKAQALGLLGTRFIEPSGYDAANLSTIRELVKLVEYSFKHPIIWQIMGTSEIKLTSDSGQVHYWKNTNRFLTEMPGAVGGKTGYTSKAGECFISVVESRSAGPEYIITVILGAQSKFLQTEKLINWAQEAYKW